MKEEETVDNPRLDLNIGVKLKWRGESHAHLHFSQQIHFSKISRLNPRFSDTVVGRYSACLCVQLVTLIIPLNDFQVGNSCDQCHQAYSGFKLSEHASHVVLMAAGSSVLL